MKVFFCFVFLFVLLPLSAMGRNLLENGSFDKGLEGWTTDYAWTRNDHYVGNARDVSVIPEHGGRRTVARLNSRGSAGTKMESILIPFRMGDNFRATLWINSPRYRVYFSGYHWLPGVRPHSNPTPPEMRQAYRSKAATGGGGWRQISLEIPGLETLTPQAISHLERVRFITLYFWLDGGGYVDDVVITKTKSASNA
jgi:hypothetical protein